MSRAVTPPRLLLLDTYGLVYAAFHALPELSTSRGLRIEAAYGFTQTLTKIIAEERPTHVVACFDRGMPKARVERFPAYKAQRAAMPDDLRSQFALVRRILEVFRIPVLELEGEEADDVIATLASKAERTPSAAGDDARAETVVLTGDNDLLQLVDARTTVLVRSRAGDPRRYDVAAVRERFDLEPSQLADYRGLKGDPSDNLPGVPGVGEKTAVKLIRAAGSLDALLADPALAGSPKLEALIRAHGEVARMCRDVSVIVRDLPVTIPWQEAAYSAPPSAELFVLYRDLEFRTLLSRLPAPSNDALALVPDDRPKVEGRYRTWVASTDPPDFLALAAALEAGANVPGSVALAFVRDEIGVASEPAHGVAFRVTALAVPAVRATLETLLLAAPIAAHDTKAASARLRELGLPVPQFADDSMIAAHLLDPAGSYARLDDAAGQYLALVVPDDVAAHADAVLRLGPVLRDHLAHREQRALYDDVERPLAAILAGMEARGIAVDVAAIEALAAETAEATLRLQDEIHELAGETFNIGSPQQLGRVLFERLSLPSAGRTKTGYATGSEVLQPLARDYAIARAILEWREVTKLRSTYLDVIPKMLDAHGRLHTQFNQTSTATGRLSSTNPNLQNIPVRTELGRRIRRAFVAPDGVARGGRVLLAADYSQIELRIMAHLSGDEAMRAAFRAGEDIHDVTARGIFGIGPGGAATRDQRRIAKSVNFGLLYGMSEFGLAQRLEIDRASARAMTEAYFARFPSVRDYIARNLDFGREHGYVETILGRRRYMPDLRSRNYALRAAAEREATNAPMQGSAADLMKLAMVRVEAALAVAETGAELLLQIHDELVFEIPRDRAETIARIVRRELEHALALSVPLEVVVKIGPTLYDIEPLAGDDAQASAEPPEFEPGEAPEAELA